MANAKCIPAHAGNPHRPAPFSTLDGAVLINGPVEGLAEPAAARRALIKLRNQARQRVNFEVRKGWRPHASTLPCTDCGHIFGTDSRHHQYDHYLGYEPEHHLTVEPVCTACHAIRTRAERFHDPLRLARLSEQCGAGIGRPPGRPPGSKTSDRDEVIRVRASSAQRTEFEVLGGADWLRATLDQSAKRRKKAKTA